MAGLYTLHSASFRPGKGTNEEPVMKTVFKVWNTVCGILIGILLILAVLLAGVRLVGLRPLTVLSGSMEPTYHVGSLIYVKSVDYKDLKAGDVITFILDEDTLATHRIVEVVPDEDDPATLRYRTKGDANESEDGSLVHYKNVVGTPVFTIPALGYIASYIQNPPGTYIALSAGAVLLLLMFIPDLFAPEEPKKSRAEKAEEALEEKAEKPHKSRKAPQKGGKYLRK